MWVLPQPHIGSKFNQKLFGNWTNFSLEIVMNPFYSLLKIQKEE